MSPLRSALLDLDAALSDPDRDLDPGLYRVEKASAAVVREARAAADEIDALRRQVAELTANGVSVHKAAAAGMADERAAIVKYLRSDKVDSPIAAILNALAVHIERGAHLP